MSYRLHETGDSATPLSRTDEENRLSKYRCIFWLDVVLVGGNVTSN
jgi:hypothetical protein